MTQADLRWNSEREYKQKIIALINEEAKRYPDFDVRLEIDHRRGMLSFRYTPKDKQWQAIQKKIRDLGMKLRLEEIQRFFHKR